MEPRNDRLHMMQFTSYEGFFAVFSRNPTFLTHCLTMLIVVNRQADPSYRTATTAKDFFDYTKKISAVTKRRRLREKEAIFLFDHIRYDINAIKKRDPAARNSFEVLLLYSGFHAVFWYRLSHWLYSHKCYFLARLISQLTRFFTGIEIHPGATIGRGLFIDHGSGVVIGETAIIGDNCTIYQGVTLGGTGKDKGKRHPTLGNNVMVGSGAKVLGPFKVGDNAKIASGAVVLSEIPADATAVGVPARIVRKNGEKVLENDLDQVHIPDPISQELCKMMIKIEHLEKKMKKLEENKTDNQTAE